MDYSERTIIIWRAAVMFCVLPCVIAAQPARPFFGNLHSHTAYSDGTGTPAQAYEHARAVAKLDFLCVSEHNHAAAEGTGDDPQHLHIALDHSLYNGSQASSLISTANKVNQDFAGSFVALYGQEFSSINIGNHINVFDVGEVIDEHLVPNKNFRKLYDGWLLTHTDSFGQAALVQFNHPHSTGEDYGALNYPDPVTFLQAATPHARTIAIISGPHDTKPGDPLRRDDSLKTEAYLFYLNLGFQLAPAADQDNHFITFGTATDHRTAIWATALTRQALLDAMRNNHVYATQDKNLVVDFRINDQIMGSKLTAKPNDPLTITVRVSDPDEPAAHYHISLRHDTVGGQIEATNEVDSTDTNGDGMVTFEEKYIGGVEYYLVQVVQTGTSAPDQAWTAPIWIGTAAPANDDPVDTPVVTPAAAGFVWSTKGHVFHLAGCRDAERIAEANKRTGNTPPPGRMLHANCPVH